MAQKKTTGEDGQISPVKIKKPIYKRVWFWIVVVIAVLAIGGAVGGGNSGKDSTTKKSAPAKKEKSSSKAATSSAANGKITRAEFDAIKIGDLLKNAEGGATLADLTKQFGKPSATSSDTTNGVKTDLVTWTNVEGEIGANVIVSFVGEKAFGKDLTGFKISRKQKITLSDFNSWANGMKYSEFISKYGQPDYYDENLIGGNKTVIAGYISGIKGDIGASLNVTFTNDALSGKNQSNMK